MQKSTAVSLFLGLGIVVLSSFAQARTIYWTGYGAVAPGVSWYPAADCQAQAQAQADQGARESCWRDFGVRYEVCQSAPVQRIEDLGTYTDYYGTTRCTQRVYLTLP